MAKIGKIASRFPSGVLVISDSKSHEEIPDWQSPDQLVTVAVSGMMMRVQHEQDGKARVRIWNSEEDVPKDVVFSGEIEVASGTLCLFNAYNDALTSCELKPGRHAVRIAVDRQLAPSKVDVFIISSA
ncbi:hypothetical protein [Nocardioides plantarum]|uniref:Uncharacterized protein n=1 Tax=Nocardioides plantarum TaxID=29299 RepID=A0ABV5KCB3_9ACTN|nr:hypothetical protein [Nocardioides plantarum]